MANERDTKNMGTAGERHPQTEVKHPEEWMEDLSPDHLAGQNIGRTSLDREQGLATAYDVKEVHRSLSEFEDSDLKQIPILPEGERLQQGATYLDLAREDREEFTALGSMVAEAGHFYVPKDQVPYPLWNRLRGEEKPVGRSDPDLPPGQSLQAGEERPDL